MSWFKVDDRLFSHPKWVATPADARGLWVTAGSWSAAQDQDGFVPGRVLVTLGHTTTQAAALVRSRLWEKAPGGYRFHGWAEFQPTRESKEARQAAKSAASILGNHRRWHEARGLVDPTCSLCGSLPDRTCDPYPIAGAMQLGFPTDSIPTRPDPTR